MRSGATVKSCEELPYDNDGFLTKTCNFVCIAVIKERAVGMGAIAGRRAEPFRQELESFLDLRVFADVALRRVLAGILRTVAEVEQAVHKVVGVVPTCGLAPSGRLPTIYRGARPPARYTRSSQGPMSPSSVTRARSQRVVVASS
jgi:hypothetical protein